VLNTLHAEVKLKAHVVKSMDVEIQKQVEEELIAVKQRIVELKLLF
jgi:hypothetical protein